MNVLSCIRTPTGPRRLGHFLTVRLGPALAAVVLAGLSAGCSRVADKELVLVNNERVALPIVVAERAAPSTLEAAGELANFIEKISGVRPAVLTDSLAEPPASAIWVGPHPLLTTAVARVKLDFEHPEEILIFCDGAHLVLAGRDRMAGDRQIEHGSANAVFTFLQKQLGVRWLWPGETGLVLPRQPTPAVAATNYRFAPPFRYRKFWPEQPGYWYRFQRASLNSLPIHAGHAFTEWWDLYHQDHPEFFALQPDGSRDAFPDGHNVKISVAAPGVREQWLDNAAEALHENPARIMFSASPNDGSNLGECNSPEARAWDHPDAEPITLIGKGGRYEAVKLADRYVHFWNTLARGLRERFPGQDLYVGAYAYGPYKNPPVAGVLEDNVVLGYVGHFPLAGDSLTEQEKADWLGWSQAASKMFFRPNLFHYSGGWYGVPTIAFRRTIEDFRFLAEHNCVGIEIDTLPQSWATQGAQYYLMVQLAYDPLQDGEKLLEDYFATGFGPAASQVRRYFEIMEEVHENILARIQHSSARAIELLEVCREVFTPAVFAAAFDAMDQAAAKVADADAGFQRRVQFIRDGLEFTRIQIDLMNTMALVRESEGRDAAAVHRALELVESRAALQKKYSDVLALRYPDWYHNARKLEDYMGPPRAEFIAAAGSAADAAKPDSPPDPTTQELFPEGGWD